MTESPRTAPFREALVGREDDAASFVPGGNEREERRGGEPVVGPDAKLVDDENLRSQIDAHAAVQTVLSLGPTEVFQQLMGPDEIDTVAVLDAADPESDGQVGLTHARRTE